MNDNDGCTVVMGGFLLILVLLASWAWKSYACGQKGMQMGFASKYEISTGCMIAPKGQWTPLESYRVL